MKIHIDCSAALLATVFLTNSLAHASDNRTAARPLDARVPSAALHGVDHSVMLYDQPGDGSLWARGASYKASFDAAGATYYPALGKSAPHDMPHAFSPDSVTLGGQPIAFERAATAMRAGDHVTLNRGAFVETYDLTPQSMEQSFVFSSLPRGGDLVVHIPVASELEGRASAAGLEFKSELGSVTYSRGVAIDARGERIDAATKLEDGAITLRVDASFLARATFPLTLDPVIGYLGISGTTSDDFSADAVWDNYNSRWIVTYEETFSATDTDVYALMLSSTGSASAAIAVDYTTSAWDAPRVANLGWAHQCLVVAAVTSGSAHTISGRTMQPSGTILTSGVQFDIGGSDVGDKLAPDVGGDPYDGGPQGYYCVVWQRQIPGGNTEIGYRIVGFDNGLFPVNYLPAGFLDTDSSPSISKSDDTDRWLVAFVRDEPGYHGDIYAAHINYLGTLTDGPFGVSAGNFAFDSQPCASTPLTGSQRSAITFSRFLSGNPNDHDIMVALIDGTSVLQTIDLNAAENSGQQSVDQLDPSIDSDGQRFIVAYAEYIPVALFYNNFYSDLAVSGDSLVLSEAHVNIWQYGLSGRRLNVAGQHAVGLSSHHFAVAYDLLGNSTDRDVVYYAIDSVQGGTTSQFCFGDGTGSACPCSNNGASGHGCSNSAQSIGAHLQPSSGIPSTLSDTLVLGCSAMPGSATCIFLQGSATISPLAFGDGLRCVGGSLIRLAVKSAFLGLASYPQAGDLSISVRGGVPAGGGQYSYQVWYRDPANFCTSATYNISNGVLVNWAR